MEERVFGLPKPLLIGLADVVRRTGAFTSRLEITHHEVPIAGLAPELDGFTIAHISDLHVGEGRWLPPLFEEAIDAVQRSQADILVNTGDFLQWDPPAGKAREMMARFMIARKPGIDG